MKRSIISLVGTLAIIALISSCDKLDQPYSVIKKGNDTTTQFMRKVLLEDYTGHKCVNCPEAALMARAMEDNMGGKLIVMSVHAGFFAEPSATGDFTANYISAAGNEWNTWFNITANPNGLVNRIAYNGNIIVGMDEWLNAINIQAAMPQEANILIENAFNTSTRELQITLHTKFMFEEENTYNLTVCITEDSLISPQKNSNPNIGFPTPIIYDWVFMDVLRTSVNGTWGEELTNDPDTALTFTKVYNTTLEPGWTAKHCHVVAFLSNAGTKEIIQAEKQAVIPE